MHLVAAGIDASVGTVGDAMDSAVMKSTIDVHKIELIKPCRPWCTRGLHAIADGPGLTPATARQADRHSTSLMSWSAPA
jgi:hypothetical protein